MTKKQNTVLFILLGTIGNILITVFFLVLFTILGGLILKDNLAMMIPFIFLLAVVLGMIIYQKIATLIIKKWNLEEKLEPLFVSKYNKKKRNPLD